MSHGDGAARLARPLFGLVAHTWMLLLALQLVACATCEYGGRTDAWLDALSMPADARTYVEEVLACSECFIVRRSTSLRLQQQVKDAKLADAATFRVALVGGSVTAQGAFVEPLRRVLQHLLCLSDVQVLNYGVPASTAMYPAHCLTHMVGEAMYSANVFIVDYGINDVIAPYPGYVLLLHTLLNLPQRPAVIVYDHASIMFRMPHRGHLRIAHKYGLSVFTMIPARFIQDAAGARSAVLFKDRVHPNEIGAVVIAGALASVFAVSLQHNDSRLEPQLSTSELEKLPAHVGTGVRTRCWTTLGEPSRRNLIPLHNSGWRFITRTDTYPTGKNGWLADKPGAALQFSLPGCLQYAEIFYLRSTDVNAGSAEVMIDGCVPEPEKLLISSHFRNPHGNFSLRLMHSTRMPIPPECSTPVLSIRVVPSDTSADVSNFQLIALACSQDGVEDHNAVQLPR